jgi:ABC-type sugar transport system permease subunit
MHNAEKRVGQYSKFEKRKFLFVYLFIAFPVLQFLVFWLYVNFSSIMLSFQDGDGVFTLENFKMVFRALKGTEGYNLGLNLWETMKRSLFLWGLDFFILFPIGVTTTYILYRRLLGHFVFRVCYIIPSLMGAVMWTQLICYLVQWDGAVTELVKFLGFNLPNSALNNGLFGSSESAFPTIVSIKIVMGLVGNNAVLTGAFSRVPDEIYESADLDGAGFWRTYISIAVPCVWSTISTLMIFSLCSFITADYNIFLFTGGNGSYDTATVGFLLYKITLNISKTAFGTPYYGYPAALGVFLTLLTLPVVLISRFLIEKIYADVEI